MAQRIHSLGPDKHASLERSQCIRAILYWKTYQFKYYTCFFRAKQLLRLSFPAYMNLSSFEFLQHCFRGFNRYP
jgi:hypothetical protein